MARPECAVPGCKGGALVAYGNKFICGDCMMKIINKQREQQQSDIDALGVENAS